MAKRHVVLAIPAYTGMVHMPTMRSLLADVLDLARAGYSVTLNDECGSTLINDARADMVAAFLATPGATDLVFLDWDVVWGTGALRRLLSHPVDIVGGIYPGRADPITFTVRTEQEGVYPVDHATGLVKVLGLHAGFLRITRSAAEKMVAHYPELTTSRRGMQIVDLFEPYRVPNTLRKLGEDYSFCQRWNDMGGTCYLDPSIQIGHIGLKTFVGEFGKFVDADKDKAA